MAALVVELDASHSPNVGEPRRRSTTTSSTRPRATRTSLPWPGWVWKWIPRSVPRREREWLSCTNSVGTPVGGPRVGAVGLHEEAALVAVDGGREQDEAVESCRKAFHDAGSLGEVTSATVERGSHMPRTATMPPPRRATRPLSAYISSRFDEFSRSQKDVAQYVVDHLDEVAFHTAEELARRASTSSSTVVRFSQALGFEGFPELQEAAREEYRHRHRRRRRTASSAAPLFSLDQTPFEPAVAADHVNVEETARGSRARRSRPPSRRSPPPSAC